MFRNITWYRILYIPTFILKNYLSFCSVSPGRVDDYIFFECLSPLCFLLIEFHCTFSISYKILPYYVYYYCISIWYGWAVGASFFLRARCTSFHIAVPMRYSVWENTRARVPHFL